MRLAEETINRMNHQLSGMFMDGPPVDDPVYSRAKLRLEQALASTRQANRLVAALFKDYAANGELRENRKEIKYGKVRHQQV